MTRENPRNRPSRRRKSVNHYSDDNPSTFTVKRKRGEPPEPPTPKRRYTPKEKPTKPRSHASSPKRKRKVVVQKTESPVKDEILSHTVSIQPVLPVPPPEKLTLQQRYPVVYATATPKAPPSPEWKLVRPPNTHREAIGANNERIQLPPAALTCFANRQDDSNFGVTGDGAGNVTLYALGAQTLPIQVLETTASQRERKRPILSKKVISFPNSVVACIWRKDRVVVLTHDELECINVNDRKRVWSQPLTIAADRKHYFPLQSLDLNATARKLLWTTAGRMFVDSDETASLYCLDFETDLQRRPIIPEGYSEESFESLAAVWDANDPEKILLVAQCDEQLDLLRIDLSGKIWQKTALSLGAGRSSQIDCSLQQSPEYLFLCTARGIRCYERSSLDYLTSYGETVSLHGKTVLWQTCVWVPEPDYDPKDVRTQKKEAWLGRVDEVHSRQKESKSANYLLVGVPHPTKGPSELKSTLYVWRPGQVTPMTTLHAPAGGLLGLSIQTSRDGWRMVTSTAEFGQAWEWRAQLQSDFAGTMYPVGYRIVEDNLEYIEDEDELDQIVVVENDDEDTNNKAAVAAATDVSDQDLAEAMRLSLLEYKKADKMEEREDTDVCVLPDEDDIEEAAVPCRPDAVLLEQPNEDAKLEAFPGSPKKDRLESVVLASLPQIKAVQRHLLTRRSRIEETVPQADSDTGAAVVMQPKPKGKRTRTANVEALLQSSIDPWLRQRMGDLREKSVDGVGSALNMKGLLFVSRPTSVEPAPATATFPDPPKMKITVNTEVEEPSKPRPSVIETASAEEKELALELLLLSPSNAATPSISDSAENMGTFDDANKKDSSLSLQTDESLEHTIPQDVGGIDTLAPSDKTPTHVPTKVRASTKDAIPPKECGDVFCAACQGRMVVHSCGKREKPIDYEAIAREERLRKEKEEAEKQRIRTEKRRAAEAKRREARRKKKEEEEQKRKEEERKRREEEEAMRQLEAGRFEQARIREHNENKVEGPRILSHQQAWTQTMVHPSFISQSKNRTASAIPSFSELKSSAQNTPSFTTGFASNNINQGGDYFHHQTWPSTSHGATESLPAATTTPAPTGNIDTSELKPSSSLSANDALEALAGLADSMPVAGNDNESYGAPLASDSVGRAGWRPTEPEPHTTAYDYNYTGSSDRRSAILSEYQSLNDGNDGMQDYTAENRDYNQDNEQPQIFVKQGQYSSAEGMVNGDSQDSLNPATNGSHVGGPESSHVTIKAAPPDSQNEGRPVERMATVEATQSYIKDQDYSQDRERTETAGKQEQCGCTDDAVNREFSGNLDPATNGTHVGGSESSHARIETGPPGSSNEDLPVENTATVEASLAEPVGDGSIVCLTHPNTQAQIQSHAEPKA